LCFNCTAIVLNISLRWIHNGGGPVKEKLCEQRWRQESEVEIITMIKRGNEAHTQIHVLDTTIH
jgi:hypothetical protein